MQYSKSILRTIRYILKASRALSASESTVFFHNFSDVSKNTVLREAFIIELCKNKRVLHFGFLDVPFSDEKLKQGQLLHSQISKEASYLYGIDIDDYSLSSYRKLTGDLNNCLFNLLTETSFPESIVDHFDVVLFSEVLEHLPNPFYALQALRTLCEVNDDAELCVTVPNAFSIYGFTAAANNVEIVHPDHFFYFSPYTLQNIITKAGFSEVKLRLYSSQGLLFSPGLTKHGVIAVCKI